MLPGWELNNLHDLYIIARISCLDLYYTDPAQHLRISGKDPDYIDRDLTAGQDLDDLDRDLTAG